MSEKPKIDWSVVDEAPAAMANVVSMQTATEGVIVSFGQCFPPFQPIKNPTIIKVRHPIRVALTDELAGSLLGFLQEYKQKDEGQKP